ncbi:MAG: B12-binding domain-containing radical SAM protein [Acidiferrobacterales bacterium]
MPFAVRRIRLLLINPRFPESFWSFRWALENILPGKRALNPPLGLATLAALCPPAWQVEIIDENIEPVPLHPQADIVGICGMAVQFPRQQELIEYYRDLGYYVVAGGSFASLCPERFEGLADTVVAGEAEYIWPAFCRDFEQNTSRARYQESGAVRLEDSPTPRFDLLKLDRYVTASMQFSRGCPYRCEFCDIIVMFGRRPRTKTPQQIGRELDVLRAGNVHNVFFVDDNLIGNKKLAKALLRYLVDYQERYHYDFQFGTETSINLADDAELLQLFRAAHFAWVFIGIESPDEDSLKESLKTQNTGRDLLTAVRTLYAHGIDVLAGFIIGFDNDTLDTFDKQYRFISDSGIQVSMIGLLTALPRTPLYERLERAGRLIMGAEHGDNTRSGTNIIPKRMSYAAMVQDYQTLYRRLFSDRGIARRILTKIRYLRNPLYEGKYPLPERLGIVRRMFTHALRSGGPLRILHVLRTLMFSPPRAWPQVLADWIAGLSMYDYIRRNFLADRSLSQGLAQRTSVMLHKLCAADIHRGVIEIGSCVSDGEDHLQIKLHGQVGRLFFARAARHLERMLHRSAATVTLHIEALREDQQRQLARLLRRLAPYGDRVSVWIDERIRPLVSIDPSAFHLVLTPVRPAGIRSA